MTDVPRATPVWPRSPYDLGDTRKCPGCFAPITATVCASCGLDLTDARTGRLLALGRGILTYEAERQRVIAEIRASPAAAPTPAAAGMPTRVAAPAAAPSASAARSVSAAAEPLASPPTPGPTAAGAAAHAGAPHPNAVSTPDATASAPPWPAPREVGSAEVAERPASAPRRRRLTMPVLLLIVGVSLVGVAAVFFLTLAWFVAGIAVRALIIGAITGAAIVGASLLRRHRLTATAEGVAVLGVLLIALDAWAVRANDLFGAGSVPGVRYAGIAVLVAAALCRVWARMSLLRAPDLVAVVAVPVGVGLLAAGVTDLASGQAWTVGLLGASVGGLAHVLEAPFSSARARRDAVGERVALAAIGCGALVAAVIVAAFVSPHTPGWPLGIAVAAVAVAGAHTLALRARGDDLPWRDGLCAVAAAAAAAVTASLGWQVGARMPDAGWAAVLGPVVAVAVAVGVDRLAAALGDRTASALADLRAARGAAAVAGAVSLLGAVLWFVQALVAIGGSWAPWRTEVFMASAAGALVPWTAVAAAVTAALLFVAPTLARPRVAPALSIAATALLLIAAAVPAMPALLVGTAVVVALAALALRRRAGRAVAPGSDASGAGRAAGRGSETAEAGSATATGRPALMGTRIRAAAVGWTVAAVLAAVVAYVAGTAAAALWPAGVAVAIAVPIALHVLQHRRGAAAGALAAAPVAVAAISALIAPAALGAATGRDAGVATALVLLQWVALAALVAAIALRTDAASRAALAWCGYVLALALPAAAMLPDSAALRREGALLGEPVLGIVRPELILASLAVIASGRSRVRRSASDRGSGLLSGAMRAAPPLVAPIAAATAMGAVRAAGATGAVWAPIAVALPVLALVWVAALVPAAAWVDARAARLGIDAGAAVAAIVIAPAVAGEAWWAFTAIVAAGLAAASVVRSWVGTAPPLAGVTSARGAGMSTAEAPRRLVAWTAVAAATGAWWMWLAPVRGAELETHTVPPAIALVLFGGALVWLRRRGEAAAAVALGLSVGLLPSAFDGWAATDSRGTLVALVGAAVALTAGWTWLRRAAPVAVAAAAVSLVAVAIVAVLRAWQALPQTGWLPALVAVALVSAWGSARASGATHRRYAAVAPSAAIVASLVGVAPWADRAAAVAIALAALALVHLAAAAVDRPPLGIAARATSGAATVVVALLALSSGGVGAVEAVSLPAAATVLAGSAWAMWRRRRAGAAWPGPERAIWLAGVVAAVAPSILPIAVAPLTTARMWLVIVAATLAAAGALLAPVRDAAPLRSWTALLLGAGALAVGVRALAAGADGAGAAAAVAGLGVMGLAAVQVWDPEDTLRIAPRAATPVAVAGALLVVVAVPVLADAALVPTVALTIASAAAAVAAAALLRVTRWAGFGAVAAAAGLVAAEALVIRRFVEVAAAPTTAEADLWVAVGAIIAAAVGVAVLRSSASRGGDLAVGGLFAAAAAGVGLGEGSLLFAAGTGAEVRTAVTVTVLTALAVVGVVFRDRVGGAPAVAAAAAAGVFGLVALAAFGVRPVELVTVPIALGMLMLGVRDLRRRRAARSWPALGPGLALLTVPSLAYDLGDSALWRVVALGVVAVALVVAGAVRRLQAPLVLGSVVVVLHAVAQLWPWISAAYVAVPWWLWLGVGGAILIILAARYERQMRALRTAFTAVASLR